jgi:1-deoxy-D-xylulose-5-phosphate reductoisomerase
LIKSKNIDFLVISLVGIDALIPTITAIEAGKDIGLATKEVLVAAGNIVMKKAKDKKILLLPIDSEHCAIHQCIAGVNNKKIKNIILTASGGPFLNLAAKKLKYVTKNDALKHPRWNMGKKISIDSATLMNKGLEVIEAHYLFNIPYENIKVVIHPQSIIHSLVEFEDGSIIAQLSQPDMRLPIQYVLTYPERLRNPWPKLNIENIKSLEFDSPDYNKFPCLKLAYYAGKYGNTCPAVLNASNEVAVKLFLEGKIKFMDIPKLVSMALNKHKPKNNNNLHNIISADSWARKEIYNAS